MQFSRCVREMMNNIPPLDVFQPTAHCSYQHMTPRKGLNFPSEARGMSPRQSAALPEMHMAQSYVSCARFLWREPDSSALLPLQGLRCYLSFSVACLQIVLFCPLSSQTFQKQWMIHWCTLQQFCKMRTKSFILTESH